MSLSSTQKAAIIGKRHRPGVGSIPFPTFIGSFNFADLSALSNVSLLSIAAGGGLIATVDTVRGSGTIDFPHPLNTAEPFEFGCLVEYNGDADGVYIQLQNVADTSFAGVQFQMEATNGIRCACGVTSLYTLKTALAVGQQFWIGVSWDATGEGRAFSIPVTTHFGLSPTTFNSTVLADNLVVISKSQRGGGGGNPLTFGNVTRMYFGTNSNTHRILRAFYRQGTLQGEAGARVESPIFTNPTLAGDTTSLIRVKEGYTGTGQRDLVLIFHAANSSEAYGSAVGNYDEGAAVAGLIQNSYITAYMRATDDYSGTTYSGPKASNWGHPTTLATWWRALENKVLADFDIRNVYLFGMSMGLVNALNFYRDFPAKVKAIVGISGVCNLAYAYASEGFQPVIDAAYGITPRNPRDPNLNPNDFLVPIKLWHGTIDTTVHKANHMDTFAATVNAVYPGRVTTVSVAGGDHLTANMFDAAAILAFLQAIPNLGPMPRLNVSDLMQQAALGVQGWITIDEVPAGSVIQAGSRLVGNTGLPNGTYRCFIPIGGLVSKVTAFLKGTFGSGSATTGGGTLQMDNATVLTAFSGVGAMATTVRQTLTLSPLQGEQMATLTIVVAGGGAPVFTEGEYFGS